MERKKTRVIAITSSKGGVGKTILTLNLAGVYEQLEKKVLLLDFDFGTGVLALNLNLDYSVTVYHLSEDMRNHTLATPSQYVCCYDSAIDVLPCPKDPRQQHKIDSRLLPQIIAFFRGLYDVILIDMTHGLHEKNIVTLDQADQILYVLTNDLMDLKNSKSFMSIMQDIERDNVKVILNRSKDPNLDYFGMFDLRNGIEHNVDYTISSGLYIKNITKYLVEGKIFTLNKNLVFRDKKDLKKLKQMAEELIGE